MFGALLSACWVTPALEEGVNSGFQTRDWKPKLLWTSELPSNKIFQVVGE